MRFAECWRCRRADNLAPLLTSVYADSAKRPLQQLIAVTIGLFGFRQGQNTGELHLKSAPVRLLGVCPQEIHALK